MYFAADDGVSGRELWVTDGSSAGTELLVDVWPGPLGSYPAPLAVVANALYFGAPSATDWEVWRSDGTAAGTRFLGPLPPSTSLWAPPQDFTELAGRLLFVRNCELYTSDGTFGGFERLCSGCLSYNLDLIDCSLDGVRVGSSIYFRGAPGNLSDDEELWASDGTRAGTGLLADIRPLFGSSPSSFTLLVADSTSRQTTASPAGSCGPWTRRSCRNRESYAMTRIPGLDSPTPPLRSLLPLNATRDRYRMMVTDDFDPELGVLFDTSRPARLLRARRPPGDAAPGQDRRRLRSALLLTALYQLRRGLVRRCARGEETPGVARTRAANVRKRRPWPPPPRSGGVDALGLRLPLSDETSPPASLRVAGFLPTSGPRGVSTGHDLIDSTDS